MYILSLFTFQRLRECGTAGALEVVDPGEGPGWPSPATPPPLIFRPNLGPEGPKKIFWTPFPPPLSVRRLPDSGTVGPV